MKNKLTLLERWSKSFSLWSMKLNYRWMDERNRQIARRFAIERILELKATRNAEDLKLSEMWEELFNWTLTYKD